MGTMTRTRTPCLNLDRAEKVHVIIAMYCQGTASDGKHGIYIRSVRDLSVASLPLGNEKGE